MICALIDRYVLDLVGLAPGVNNMSDSNGVGDTRDELCLQRQPRRRVPISCSTALPSPTLSERRGITQVTYTPSPEAVDEFKVQQTNFSAEYGFSGASVSQHGHAFRRQFLPWQRLRFSA